jgi:hypothetical protein
MALLPQWESMCTQNKVYIIMTVIAIVLLLLMAERYGDLTLGKALFWVLMQCLSLFVMVWFISWLCSTQRPAIAWLIVFMPFIQFALTIIFS